MHEVKRGGIRAKVKNNREVLVGLVGLVQTVGVQRLGDRTNLVGVGRLLVGLVGLVRSRPEGPVALHTERSPPGRWDIV